MGEMAVVDDRKGRCECRTGHAWWAGMLGMSTVRYVPCATRTSVMLKMSAKAANDVYGVVNWRATEY